MRLHSTSLGLLAALSLNAELAHACGGFPVMSTELFDGRKVELVIDWHLLLRADAWAPGRGDPPLSVASATEIAMAWAKDRYVRFDDVSVREISLLSLGCQKEERRWYYVFDLAPMMDGREMLSSGDWVAVLMDGTVIETRTSEK